MRFFSGVSYRTTIFISFTSMKFAIVYSSTVNNNTNELINMKMNYDNLGSETLILLPNYILSLFVTPRRTNLMLKKSTFSKKFVNLFCKPVLFNL